MNTYTYHVTKRKIDFKIVVLLLDLHRKDDVHFLPVPAIEIGRFFLTNYELFFCEYSDYPRGKNKTRRLHMGKVFPSCEQI